MASNSHHETLDRVEEHLEYLLREANGRMSWPQEEIAALEDDLVDFRALRPRLEGNCYNPNCNEDADWSDDVNEAYCSNECAVEARSGRAAQ